MTPSAVVERHDLPQAEAGDPAQLEGAARESAPQLVEGVRAAALGQLLDYRGQSAADARELGQPAFGEEPGEVAAVEPLEHPGTALVRPGAERLAPDESQEIGGLGQGPSDRKMVHCLRVEQVDMPGSRGELGPRRKGGVRRNAHAAAESRAFFTR